MESAVVEGRVRVPHVPSPKKLRSVRSTLLASSRHGLEERGHLATYLQRLGSARDERLREATMVTQWLSVDLATAHYAAADALELSEAELREVGNVVGARLEGSLLGSLARLARTSGVTPWTVLQRLERVWGRMYQGGSVAVFELAPKDAVIEVRRNPLADLRYWRVALCGLMRGSTEIFARSAHVSVEPQKLPGAARYHISWA